MSTRPSSASPVPLVRWEPRIYPGSLALVAEVRAHLHHELVGFPAELVEDVQLCASELFTNAVNHTASGAPDGQVVCALSLPSADRLRLKVTDSGLTPHRPHIPNLNDTEWLTAEHHRGLLLVATLAREWGYHPAVAHSPVNLGLVVWADFTLEPAQIPPGLPAFIPHT